MTTPVRRAIPAERHADRIRRLRDLVGRSEIDAVLVGVGPDLHYLTAYDAMPLERLTMLVVVAAEEPFVVVPRLEEPAARAGLRVATRIVTWQETDDPHAIVADAVRRGGHPGAGHDARVAVSD